MRFQKDNKIMFSQYFSWYQGVPSDVDFKVDVISANGLMWLRASNYGDDPYGNGPICVYLKTEFMSEQPKRLIKKKVKVKPYKYKNEIGLLVLDFESLNAGLKCCGPIQEVEVEVEE